MDVEKNLSPRTRRAYVYDLERFMDFWIKHHGGNPLLQRITTKSIKDYLEYLRMDLHYKSTTLSRTIASLRIFFEFCVVQGILKDSPASHIHNPKIPRRLPIFLVETETQRLLESPESYSPTAGCQRSDYKHLPTRDYAILVTLLFTGIRLRELVDLNMRNVDIERTRIRVLGKGSRERMVPLNDSVVKGLRKWIALRKPADPNEESLFLSRFGKRLSPLAVQEIVRKYVKIAGIPSDTVSPHKLRHTFATLLHLNGVDIVEIQALMGHAAITSTQIYTHTDSSRLRKAVHTLDKIGPHHKEKTEDSHCPARAGNGLLDGVECVGGQGGAIMGEQRRRFTSEEKVKILRRHLVEKVPISQVCQETGIQPTQFYRWQQTFFENGAAAFERTNERKASAQEERISFLESRILRKDEVLAELMEEHVALKKTLGGL